MKRRKVYYLKRTWIKGDRGTSYRLWRGHVKLLDLWEESGTLIINYDYHGSAKAVNEDKSLEARSMRRPQPQELLALAVLSEEYGTTEAYNHYRAFTQTLIWEKVSSGIRERFVSEEVFEAFVQAKMAKRDADKMMKSL